MCIRDSDKPLFNYIFAVGCHSVLGQDQSNEPLIEYSKSKALEESLSCNAKSIKHLTNYINKIKNLDPNSLIIILPDHYPPGVSEYKDAGYKCSTNNQISSCPQMMKMRVIFIEDAIDMNIKNTIFSFYEIPEIIINYICLLYTSPSPRDATLSRMPSSA